MPAVSGMIRAMAAVPRVHLANPKKNAGEISALLDIAQERGAQLVVFPELSLTGYTCADLFMQDTLLTAAREALADLAAQDRGELVFIVGLPLEMAGRLYNVAAVIHRGDVHIVPKEHLPSHGEFQERRWFAPGHTAPDHVRLPGVGRLLEDTALVARQPLIDCGSFTLGVEICEDLWSPQAPSSMLCMRGATVIANLSAGSELMGKHAQRRRLIAEQSARCCCGYVYANAGYGESTTDLVFSGYAGIYENGEALAETERFARAASYTLADIDVSRLRFKRRQMPSFCEAADQSAPGSAESGPYNTPTLSAPPFPEGPLCRPLERLPFVPKDDALLHEALMIQTQALLTRMEHIRTQKLVVGVSGGLDSTLALLAAAYAFTRAGWDRRGIIGITMPGFGTGKRTRGNADRLMEQIGCTCLTIPIGAAVTQHFADIGQDADVHDVCYENSQARERTQIVMDYANKAGALALGTGDLSELALGFCTYNGDHMSMYNLNGSVTKTLIRPLAAYCARLLGDAIVPIVQDIIDTPVSPELIPGKEGELTQRTEETLGDYALHDFFLYHMLDSGASPKKLYALACQAFDGAYAPEVILRALRTFVRRFFTQQFKRSAMPDGPKVSPVSLSPRGDWRMPSDAQMQLWMDEVESLSHVQSLS